MAARQSIEYRLEPRTIDAGMSWLTLTLTHAGDQSLGDLEVRLNSLDSWALQVYGVGEHLLLLEPGVQEQIHFQVSSVASGLVYASLDGRRRDLPFHWESPSLLVRVREDPAELVSLLALTEPYLVVGRKVRCEATIRGLVDCRDLRLEFWVETPSYAFDRVATVRIERLAADEEKRYSAEVEVDQEGAYTVYAYLYDDHRRIGRKKEYVYVFNT